MTWRIYRFLTARINLKKSNRNSSTKNIITEIKNAIGGLNRILEAEERISDLEDIPKSIWAEIL